jgi:hypothetical protein
VIPVIGGLSAMALVGVIFLYHFRTRKRFQELLWQYAQDRGFGFLSGSWRTEPKAVGGKEGREIIVDAYQRRAGNSQVTYSRVRLDSPRLPRDLVLKGEGWGSTLWKVVAGSDEVLGDEDFDNQVLVRGDEAAVTALLDERTREVISVMVAAGIKLEKGQLYFEKKGYFQSSAEIDVLLIRMNEAADRLGALRGPREDKLLTNVLEDSDPEVRARNLAMLGLHHRHSIGVEMALKAVLGTDPAAVEEGRLLAVLSDGGASLDRQAAVAMVLARSGSAGAVPLLREWAVGIDGQFDFLKRLADKAVAAIQLRIGPVEGGGLSMAQGSSGALSEVEGQGGELSLAEQEARRKKRAAAQKGRR